MAGEETEVKTVMLSESQGIELLKLSLQEAQNTVRSYDTKAQIVGVGYIFSLGIITQVDGFLPKPDDFNALTLVFAWVIVILPIILFGVVLHPTRKTAQSFHTLSAPQRPRILYVEPKRIGSPEALLENARDTSLLLEISHEVWMVASLREEKRKRFLRALYGAAFSYAFLFVTQFVRLVNG